MRTKKLSIVGEKSDWAGDDLGRSVGSGLAKYLPQNEGAPGSEEPGAGVFPKEKFLVFENTGPVVQEDLNQSHVTGTVLNRRDRMLCNDKSVIQKENETESMGRLVYMGSRPRIPNFDPKTLKDPVNLVQSDSKEDEYWKNMTIETIKKKAVIQKYNMWSTRNRKFLPPTNLSPTPIAENPSKNFTSDIITQQKSFDHRTNHTQAVGGPTKPNKTNRLSMRIPSNSDSLIQRTAKQGYLLISPKSSQTQLVDSDRVSGKLRQFLGVRVDTPDPEANRLGGWSVEKKGSLSRGDWP